MDQLKTFASEHPLLASSIGLSAALLLLFLVGQQLGLKALDLDVKWIAVAVFPALVALIIGGYIKSFKGFGVELEARLKNPVSTVRMTAKAAATRLSGDEKQSVQMLSTLQDKDIERLIFVESRQDYYRPLAIQQYLLELRKLKYIEIRSAANKFIALLPINLLRKKGDIDLTAIQQFIDVLADGNIRAVYGSQAITLVVRADDTLLEVLIKMREARASRAVVLTESEQFFGLLNVRDVESRIADDVLESKRMET